MDENAPEPPTVAATLEPDDVATLMDAARWATGMVLRSPNRATATVVIIGIATSLLKAMA